MTEPVRPPKPPLTLRQLAYAVTAVVATSAFSLPLLAVAVLTGFRARRFYSEVMVRRFCQLLLRMARTRVTQHGRESVPPGPVFYMPNHPSTLDVFILTALGLPNTRFFMGRRVVRWLPLGLIAWIMGVLFTPNHDDTPARIRCFQRAHRHLRRTHESILGTPEGQIVPGSTVGPFRRGVFHLATLLGYPIVPIYLAFPTGTSAGRGYAPRSSAVGVFFLPAIDTSGWQVEEVDSHKEQTRRHFLAFAAELEVRGADEALAKARARAHEEEMPPT